MALNTYNNQDDNIERFTLKDFFFKSFNIEDFEDLILACRNLEELGILYLSFEKDKILEKYFNRIERNAIEYFFNEVAIKLKNLT